MWEGIDNVGVMGTQSDIDWYKENLPWVENALGERLGDNNGADKLSGSNTYVRFFNPTGNSYIPRVMNPLKEHPLYSYPGWTRGHLEYRLNSEGPANKHAVGFKSPPVIHMSSPSHKWYDGLSPRRILLHEALHRKQIDPKGWAEASKPVNAVLAKDPVYAQHVDWFTGSFLPELYGGPLSESKRKEMSDYMNSEPERFAYAYEQWIKHPLNRNISRESIEAFDNMSAEIQRGRQ